MNKNPESQMGFRKKTKNKRDSRLILPEAQTENAHDS